jgi:hypothetical protein
MACARVSDLRRDAADEVGYADPQPHPDQPAQAAQGDGLGEELEQDVPPPRPHGFAQADLPRPLRHRDQHDVHDPNAPHDQGDGGDGPQEDRKGPRDLGRGLDQVLLADEGEIVVVAIQEAVALPQGGAGGLHHRRHRGRALRLDQDLGDHLAAPELAAPGQPLQGGGQRDEDLVVGAAEPGSTHRGEDADHAEGDVVEPDEPPDGIPVGEELGGHVRPQDRHGGPGLHMGGGEEVAAGHLEVADGEELRRHALDGDPQIAPPEDHLGVRLEDRGHRRHPGQLRQGPGVGRGQRGGGAGRLGDPAHPQAARRHEDQVGPNPLDLGADRLLSSPADAHQGDHRGHPDDHPQHRQEGTHLVGHQARHRRSKSLQKAHPYLPFVIPADEAGAKSPRR